MTERPLGRAWPVVAAGTIILLASCVSSDAVTSEVTVIPRPLEVVQQAGSMRLPSVLRCHISSPELRPLVEVLDYEYGMLLQGRVVEDSSGRSPCRLSIDASLDTEEYRLDVGRTIEVRGGSYGAVAMGTVTMLQSLRNGRIPRMQVVDRPASSYRGLLIDVARRRHSIEVLKQLVILARWYKINHLQLHLTDDELFTFPTATHPRLPTPGAHFTKEELRELDRYARDRGVAIVPELEVPGHAGQFIARMPEIFAIRDVEKNRRTINMGREEVYEALDRIIGEVAEVFETSRYVHIGGDEASRAGLAEDPDVRQYLARHGLSSVEELYRHFLVRMNEIVKRHGKQTIVWEGFGPKGEVEIPRDILVMAWETMYQLPQDLLANGYTIVNASWKPLYVVNRKKWDPGEIYAWNMYRWENWVPSMPSIVPIQLEPAARVIGGSMSSWDQPEHVELHSLRRRLAAMSERVWAPTIDPAVPWSTFSATLERTDASLGDLITPIDIDATGLSHPGIHDGNRNEHRWFGERLTLALPARAGLSIHYTTDGAEPSRSSPQYTTPIGLTGSATFKARAFRGSEPVGFTVWREYELHPIEARISGRFKVPPDRSWEAAGGAVVFHDEVVVELERKREGTIRYTTDGSAPTATSPPYEDPLRLTARASVAAQLFDAHGRPAGHRWSERFEPVHETGFLNRTLALNGKTYRYVVYVPPDHQKSRALPVLLFLHGAGERGDDGLRQTAVGLAPAIRANPDRFPMIVVFPQAPADTQWLGDQARFAMMALERTAVEFGGDPERFYLTGLSLGGYGTWHLALENPGRFAALVPVCGGIVKPETAQSVRRSPLTAAASDPYAFTAERVGQTPVWIFHGAADGVIPASESRRMHEELQRVGGDVRYTEYPGVGHNAWDPAYADPALWTWLLRQRLPGVVSPLR